MFTFRRQKRIYLDYAAATPVRAEVLATMQPYFSSNFANPGAIHQEGQLARRAVEKARLEVARVLGVRTDDVIWTGSGTEANNLAILGYLRQLTEAQAIPYSELEIITTAIEHPSVLEACEQARKLGASLKQVAVDGEGRINRTALKELLTPKTALVVFSYVNSEIGTVEDVRAVTRLVREFNEEHTCHIKVHLDAAQAPLWLPCKLEQLGVDMITLDAGKCYGPKGIGVLARRHGVSLQPVVLGGGQERGMRSGTENVPYILGAAKAIVIAQEEFIRRADTTQKIRDYAIKALTAIDGVLVNGSILSRVANNVNISITGVEAEFAVVTLDLAGIACSTKSACGAGKGVGSSVVRTITGSDERAISSLRFTLGEDTTKGSIDRLATVLEDHISKTRAFAKKMT